MSSPSNLLPNGKRLALAGALCAACFGAQGAPQTKIEWLTEPPCSESLAEEMPSQPELGLALYRFACPGAPAKLVSGRRLALATPLFSSAALARGERPEASALSKGAPIWISSAAQAPLDISKAERSQARRALRAGEPLLARDFEPRRLWIGGEPVLLSLRQGAVTTTVQATAQGVGRWGERASAKTEQGKVFSGVAAMCPSGPCLDVGR